MLAGVPGFEPGLSVLETDVLTVDTIPLQTLPIANFRLVIMPAADTSNRQLAIGNWQLAMSTWFPYDLCVCGNVDKTWKIPADRAWSSYS
jgi:hypothetical protein